MELGVALIACCLPSLKPLFSHILAESLSAGAHSKVSLNSLPFNPFAHNRENPNNAAPKIQRPSIASTAALKPHINSNDGEEWHILEEMSASSKEPRRIKKEVSVSMEHV